MKSIEATFGGEPFDFLLEAAAMATSNCQYEESAELLAVRRKLMKMRTYVTKVFCTKCKQQIDEIDSRNPCEAKPCLKCKSAPVQGLFSKGKKNG